MPNYRRAQVCGGTFFFTLVTHGRRRIFLEEWPRNTLGDCFRECERKWPFTIDALVLLPDHLHAIWSLPLGDSAYSRRWSWIKREFTKRYLASGRFEGPVSQGRRHERRRGVWQPRFWEHTLEDEEDYHRHFDYVHYNPVKHGYVKCPHEWPYSSFHRWVKRKVLPWHWGCWRNGEPAMSFKDIEGSVGE